MGTVTRRECAAREVDAKPYAASLIEGRRERGYIFETAQGDIIDKAITLEVPPIWRSLKCFRAKKRIFSPLECRFEQPSG